MLSIRAKNAMQNTALFVVTIPIIYILLITAISVMGLFAVNAE